jgi:hypothetical protein
MKHAVFNGTQNEYDKALPIFKEHMRIEAYQNLWKQQFDG